MKIRFVLVSGTVITLVSLLIDWVADPVTSMMSGRLTGTMAQAIEYSIMRSFIIGDIAPVLIMLVLWVKYKKFILSFIFALLSVGYIAVLALQNLWEFWWFNPVIHPFFINGGKLPKYFLDDGLFETINLIISFVCIGYLGYLLYKSQMSEVLSVQKFWLGVILLVLLVVLLVPLLSYILLILACATGDCL